jgi:hypothetical protein
MKDQILDAIGGSEPVDALNALFSVAFLVAKASLPRACILTWIFLLLSKGGPFPMG